MAELERQANGDQARFEELYFLRLKSIKDNIARVRAQRRHDAAVTELLHASEGDVDRFDDLLAQEIQNKIIGQRKKVDRPQPDLAVRIADGDQDLLNTLIRAERKFKHAVNHDVAYIVPSKRLVRFIKASLCIAGLTSDSSDGD